MPCTHGQIFLSASFKSAPITKAKVIEIPKITFWALASSVGSRLLRLRISAAFSPQVAKVTENSLGDKD